MARNFKSLLICPLVRRRTAMTALWFPRMKVLSFYLSHGSGITNFERKVSLLALCF